MITLPRPTTICTISHERKTFLCMESKVEKAITACRELSV